MLGGGGDVDGNKLKQEYEGAKEENERLKKQIQEVKEEVRLGLCRSKRGRICEMIKNSLFLAPYSKIITILYYLCT